MQTVLCVTIPYSHGRVRGSRQSICWLLIRSGCEIDNGRSVNTFA